MASLAVRRWIWLRSKVRMMPKAVVKAAKVAAAARVAKVVAVAVAARLAKARVTKARVAVVKAAAVKVAAVKVAVGGADRLRSCACKHLKTPKGRPATGGPLVWCGWARATMGPVVGGAGGPGAEFERKKCLSC